MVAKKKTEEVSVVETKRNSDLITDLEVLVKDKVIGKIHKGENDRQYETTFMDERKGANVSVEDAVQAIIAYYNLHK